MTYSVLGVEVMAVKYQEIFHQQTHTMAELEEEVGIQILPKVYM